MKRILLAVVMIAVVGCTKERPQGVTTQQPQAPDHEQEALKWRSNRLARLQSEDSWLTLVGLTWLNEGDNSVSLPVKPPVKIQISLKNGQATLLPQHGGLLTSGGKPIEGALPLRNDLETAGPTVVEHGTLRFHVIKRGDRHAVRMKDPNSEARAHFAGLTYFPFNPKWRVEARFTPFERPRRIPIANVTGMTTEELSPGTLSFVVNGKTYSLQPILEQGEKDFFIIFKDQTSGKETYPAARYVYAPPPGPDGTTVIDFNRAYNPPCAFTPFATCPLPPPQNRLAASVEAGEKTYAGGHGSSG